MSGIEALAAGEALLNGAAFVRGDFETPWPLGALSVSGMLVWVLFLFLKRPMTGSVTRGCEATPVLPTARGW